MSLGQKLRLQSLSGPVLITGHTGFKGTWLTLLLEKLNIEVVGYSLSPEKDGLFDRANRTGAIREEFADIRDSEKLDSYIQTVRPSAIIHMAAQPLVLASYRIPKETFDVNVIGTVNMLNSAFSCDSINAVVAVTTDKVYRNDNSVRAFIESDALEGKDPYSASKVGAEAAVSAWQQIARVRGGPRVVSVRAGNVIGGGDWATERLLPDLLRSFIKKESFVVRNPNSTRPWQHVLDPINGYLDVLEFSLGNDTASAFNFGPDSSSLSVSEVIKIASKQWQGRLIMESGLNDQPSNIEALNLSLDSSLAHKMLGWAPYWSQESAIVATIKWWDKVLNYGIDANKACLDDISELIENKHFQND
jgi:CDP-glucose 4,6-dehydratase